MSRFKVTIFKWNADSEYCLIFDTYLIEAINSEDSEHDCLGNYEAIWGGREALVEYIKVCYGVEKSELVFVSEEKKANFTSIF